MYTAPKTTPSTEQDLKSILAKRGAAYGPFTTQAEIVQDLKDVMHNCPGWDKLTPSMKESLEMNVHKIGRILNGDPTEPDHWLDIAGYSKLVADELLLKQFSKPAEGIVKVGVNVKK